MKVGFVLFFLLHLHDALSKDYPVDSKGISHKKSFPKKSLQILISRKLFKPVPSKTKKPAPTNDGYTVFPAIGTEEKKVFNVPDSLFFPANAHEQKSRVKKVLPEYTSGAVRRKRSVVKKENDKAVSVAGAPKVSEASNKNKTSSRRSEKKTKRKGSNTKRSNKLRSRKRALRNSNATNTGKPLKYTKRPSRKHRVNNTKIQKKGGKSQKENVKAVSKKESSRRLIAARDATIEDYPYVVSIQKNGEHWCAGALLNPRLVITTANCVWKASRLSRLKIRAGSSHADRGGQTAYIQEALKHPNWNIRKNPDNDVALLLLDRNIKFSDSVHGVDLPNRIMLPAFHDAWVVSWGAERRDGVYDKKSMSLQSIHVQLMDRVTCNNVTQRYGVVVTNNFVCLSQVGNRAPCTRDTGAPAVSDGVLWGLASWGIRKLCGTQRFPAMYSYLASQTNMDFVANATSSLMADQRHYPFPDRYTPVFRAESTTRRRRG